MLLNALTSYLQHQSASTTRESDTTSAVTQPNGDTAQTSRNTPDSYQPSTRAILISALASDINVNELDDTTLNHLQDSLQQFGLISPRDLSGMSLLRQAMQGAETTTNSVELLDHLAAQEQPYQQQQAVKRLQALFHNLASAQPSPQAA